MKIEDLKERQKITMASMEYSLKRIDLLVISISGAGIYICLEALKFLKGQELLITKHIHIAGGLFLLAIVINFISQFLGFATNKLDHEWSYLRIRYKLKKKNNRSTEEKAIIDAKDSQSDRYNYWTVLSNVVSSISMGCGLFALLYYFAFIF